MISKELLSEVLEEEVLSVRPYISDDPFYKNIIMWECRKNTYDTINIYELAHKCKEWANNKGHSYIGNNKLINIYSQDNQIIALVNKNIVNWYDVNVDFIACQWILDNKEGI